MSQSKKEFREFTVYQVLAEDGASSCLAAVEGSEYVQQDSWVGWQEKVVSREAYEAKCREVEELVEALKKIKNREIPLSGPYTREFTNETYERIASEALEKHQQGEVL
jgi:hypothetical protein